GISTAEQSATDAFSSAAKTTQERSQAAEKAYKASTDKKVKPNDRKKIQQQYKSLEAQAKSAEEVARVKKAELDQLVRKVRTSNTVAIVLGGMFAFAIVV